LSWSTRIDAWGTGVETAGAETEDAGSAGAETEAAETEGDGIAFDAADEVSTGEIDAPFWGLGAHAQPRIKNGTSRATLRRIESASSL
jgi:hypothetical protein